MSSDDKYIEVLSGIKNKIANRTLFLGLILGVFLLVFSSIRLNEINQIELILSNGVIFLFVILLNIFRNKIPYRGKVFITLCAFLFLATSNFVEQGFASLGFMWLILATVMAFVFADIYYAIGISVLSLIIVFVVRLLSINGIVVFGMVLNGYTYTNYDLINRFFNYLFVSYIIIFSLKQIITRFDIYAEELTSQRQNIISSAVRIQHEIENRKKSELAAKVSETKFKNIFNSSLDPMLIINSKGELLEYNSSYLKILEFPKEHLDYMNIVDVAPDENRDFWTKYKSDFVKNLPARFGLKFISKKTKNKIYLDIVTNRIVFDAEDAVLIIFRDNSLNVLRERMIYSAALEAEEAERFRLSKELHDGLGPLLSTLKIYYEVWEKHPGDVEIQERIKKILDDSIASVKEISNNLSPYILQNLGVFKALQTYIDKIVFSGKLDIVFVHNTDVRFSEKVEIAIYRLVTELIHNTIKHAEATRVDIAIRYCDGIVKVEYSDNGKGFDVSKKRIGAGLGLVNMKSRIENLDGKCEIISSEGEGFKMFAELDIS